MKPSLHCPSCQAIYVGIANFYPRILPDWYICFTCAFEWRKVAGNIYEVAETGAVTHIKWHPYRLTDQNSVSQHSGEANHANQSTCQSRDGNLATG